MQLVLGVSMSSSRSTASASGDGAIVTLKLVCQIRVWVEDEVLETTTSTTLPITHAMLNRSLQKVLSPIPATTLPASDVESFVSSVYAAHGVDARQKRAINTAQSLATASIGGMATLEGTLRIRAVQRAVDKVCKRVDDARKASHTFDPISPTEGGADVLQARIVVVDDAEGEMQRKKKRRKKGRKRKEVEFDVWGEEGVEVEAIGKVVEAVFARLYPTSLPPSRLWRVFDAAFASSPYVTLGSITAHCTNDVNMGLVNTWRRAEEGERTFPRIACGMADAFVGDGIVSGDDNDVRFSRAFIQTMMETSPTTERQIVNVIRLEVLLESPGISFHPGSRFRRAKRGSRLDLSAIPEFRLGALPMHRSRRKLKRQRLGRRWVRLEQRTEGGWEHVKRSESPDEVLRALSRFPLTSSSCVQVDPSGPGVYLLLVRMGKALARSLMSVDNQVPSQVSLWEWMREYEPLRVGSVWEEGEVYVYVGQTSDASSPSLRARVDQHFTSWSGAQAVDVLLASQGLDLARDVAIVYLSSDPGMESPYIHSSTQVRDLCTLNIKS